MTGEPYEKHQEGAKDWVHPIDAAVADLAERQLGVVAIGQLLELGMTRRAVAHRVASGRLHRLFRGVFAVGHRGLSKRGWWMAAVLSVGVGAVLSHRPAGAEWNLRAWNGRPAITTPKWRPTRAEIEVHSAELPPDEVTVKNGIPITSMPRTILDLATVLDADALARAVEEAEFQRLSDPLSLPAILKRHQGERGTRALRRVLQSAGYAMGVTNSPLEEAFVRFVGEHGLPHPELNASLRIAERYVRPDCLWRSQRVIVELHSAMFHGHAPAVTRDAGRDRLLIRGGWTVIHVTWAQLHDEAERLALAADLRALLAA